MPPTILFDFDGTLALGDGPITAFARAIAERTADASFAARAEAAIADFAAGTADARDGYDAVTRIARDQGVDAAVIGAAYDDSRALLGTDEAPVVSPDGLADFLDTLSCHARLVLATNAPGDGIAELLDTWGVTERFDAVHFAVGKPAGLVPLIREALATGPLLAVGDIVENDLAPAAVLGADTALVGATFERSTADATMRGHSLADLYDRILDWARTASSAPASSAGSTSPSSTLQS